MHMHLSQAQNQALTANSAMEDNLRRFKEGFSLKFNQIDEFNKMDRIRGDDVFRSIQCLVESGVSVDANNSEGFYTRETAREVAKLILNLEGSFDNTSAISALDGTFFNTNNRISGDDINRYFDSVIKLRG